LRWLTWLCRGWLASPDKLAELGDRLLDLKEIGLIIIDPISNAAVRFEQLDGSLGMPQKVGNAYHLPGRVKVIEDAAVARLVSQVISVVTEKCANAKLLIIPPLPRYITAPCCNNPSHCSNRGEVGFAENLLSELTRVRTEIKKVVVGRGRPCSRVVDSLAGITGFMGEQSRPGNKELVDPVKKVTARDGIHLNDQGLKNLASFLGGEIEKMYEQNTAVVSATGTKRTCGYYWRGFSSERGSNLRSTSSQQWGPQHRGRAVKKRPTPYSRSFMNN